MTPNRSLAAVRRLLIVALATTCLGALAQDDKRSAALREAARRAQAAAQAAQQEAAQLRSERDALARADQTRQTELDQRRTAQRTAAGQLAAARQALAQAQAERDRLNADHDRTRGERDEIAQRLQRQQAETERLQSELAEQRRLTQTLSALLQRSTQSLAAAESANRQLQTLGLQAVDAYQHATPEAMRARDEPFLGLAAVRLGNEAELLRREMGALKLVP
ncbi:hypothetical protein KAK07_06030 [Ideonella sp. 4Y16]|uniref:hypothetical protein n=1 Tax=Ideonella alba TaxID=2824118 RepID=UPI001B35A2D0|nr:hypothetical protein [Ideonella alba]MBQ0942885.1 hypothetical protein [Ideonella alba]